MKLTAGKIKECLCNTPQITFEITEKCNLNCLYCGYGKLYSDKDPRKNRDLPVRWAMDFLNYMAGLWKTEYNTSARNNVHVSFYGGEPLINFGFIEHCLFYDNQCPFITQVLGLYC